MFTCSLELHNHHSPYPRDEMLCAHGNAYSTQWVGIGLAHTSNSHTFMIFIISHKDSYNKQYPLTNPHLDTHVVTYLNPNNYKYSPQTCSLTYSTKDEPKLITILCVHQFQWPSIIPIFARRFQYCLGVALHLTRFPLTRESNPLDNPTKVNLSKKQKHTPPLPIVLDNPPSPFTLPTLVYTQPQVKHPTTHTLTIKCLPHPLTRRRMHHWIRYLPFHQQHSICLQTTQKTKYPMRIINNHLCHPPLHQRQHYTFIYLHKQLQLHLPSLKPPLPTLPLA